MAAESEKKMSEQFRQNNPVVPPQADQDVLALVKRIQQQISFLEKKVDTLIAQLQERPTFQPRTFSRPHRPFGHAQHHGKGEHREGSGERDFNRPRHFERRNEDENKGFDRKKKPFYYKKRQRG